MVNGFRKAYSFYRFWGVSRLFLLDPQVSRDGGLAVPSSDVRGSSDIVEGGRMALDNKTSLLNTQPPRAFSGPRAREYNPYPYSDTINTYDKTALKEAVFDDDMDQLRDGLY